MLIVENTQARDLAPSSIDSYERIERALSVLGAESVKVEDLIERSKLELVHETSYLDGLAQMAQSGTEVPLDPELSFSLERYQAALGAARTLEVGLEGLLAAEARIAFCLTRPGSHHAGPGYALGHCIFNNLAIAAALARQHGIERVAIVDFDAHHGNGTEEIFADDDSVLTISLHQFPFYPGTGDHGEPEEALANLNLPLAAGCSDALALQAFDEAISRLGAHQPGLVLVEAGLDGHIDDPSSDLALERWSFRTFGEGLAGLGCPLLIELGGGYAESSIREGLGGFVEGLFA